MHSSCTLSCSLAYNNLDAKGGAAIAESLKGNTTLTSLEQAAQKLETRQKCWLSFQCPLPQFTQ